MDREQFTFYASFARAIQRIRKKSDRCAAYDAIVNYALYERLPEADTLPDAAAIVFELVRPNLDASRVKARNGKTGGESGGRAEANNKQTAGKREANDKQTASKRENEDKTENKNEYKNENECSTTPDPPVGEVMALFLDRVNSSPSAGALSELKGYTERLGAPVVRHAIEIALDEGKTGWAYIRAILQRYEREGLRTLEAVKASEAARAARRGGRVSGPGRKGVVCASESVGKTATPVCLEQLKGLLEEV